MYFLNFINQGWVIIEGVLRFFGTSTPFYIYFFLTDCIFETSWYTESQVHHKSQPFWVKTVHLVPNVHTLAGHAIGAILLAPTSTLHFDTVHKTIWFFFLAKIRLEIINISCGVSGNLSKQEWRCQNSSKVVLISYPKQFFLFFELQYLFRGQLCTSVWRDLKWSKRM